MPTFLDIEALCRKIGGTRPIDRSTVYRKIQAGLLPKPIKLGRLSRWLEDEIDQVLSDLADARDRATPTNRSARK
jgi:predicted DNA-binding transcriptional regulator AlpA